jgi:hypothetical protein
MARKLRRPPAKRGASTRTIGDEVLDKLKELHELLTSMPTHEGPNAYMNSLATLGVAKDLSPAHHLELSALVARFYAEGNCVKWLEPQKRERRVWARQGHGRVRKVRKKMKDAGRAINAVRAYLKQIDIAVDQTIDKVLDRSVAVLDSSMLETAYGVISSLKTTDPHEGTMVALFDFFVNECGLHKNEAEVRVGKIGNYFWEWKVSVIEHYSGRGENWKGCPAVRQAVARQKRTTNRPPKTR